MSIPKTRSLSVLALLTLPAIAFAQDKVVPPHLTSVEGSDYFDLPFVYNAGRHQQIWEGPAVCATTALITQVSFRRDTDYRTTNYPAVKFPNTTVRLGSTPVSPSAMTTNYASNLVGATMTTIVNNVTYSLPTQVTYPSVAPFNVHYPASSPVLFLRSQGNLIMEWVHPGQANQKTIYTLDGETPSTFGGYVRPIGSFGTFSSGDTPTFLADAGSLVPGGSMNLTVSPLKSAYPAFAFFGISETNWGGITLPLDLALIGAAGSTLYIDRLIEVPLPVSAVKNGFAGTLKSPIPSTASLSGNKLFVQTWFADPNANGLGLVTSNALELTAGSGKPYTQLLSSSDSAAATGFFEKGAGKFGGPVVKLFGAIL